MLHLNASMKTALGAVFCALQALGAQSRQSQDSEPIPRTSSQSSLDLGAGRQQVEHRMTPILVSGGYANVAVVREGRRVFVAFENTRYRDERRAMQEAARALLPELREGEELVLVPSSRAIPLVAIRYDTSAAACTATDAHDAGCQPAEISLDVSDIPPALSAAPRASSSFGRLDVVVHPWFEAMFGDYDNPVASRTGIAPELRVALRRGMSVSAQVLFTIQDDMPTGDSRVRPALVTVNQTLRLPKSVFVSATAGTFLGNHYGLDVESRAYLANGRWVVGAQLGLTGASSFAKEQWQRLPMRDRTALLDVARRVPKYDLTVRATAGMFLEQERGVRLDVMRRFRETEIGWFALAGGEGVNGGITLRIPLPPGRHGKPAPARFLMADAFRWQYRYRGYVFGGRRYSAGNVLDELGRSLDPDWLRTSDVELEHP